MTPKNYRPRDPRNAGGTDGLQAILKGAAKTQRWRWLPRFGLGGGSTRIKAVPSFEAQWRTHYRWRHRSIYTTAILAVAFLLVPLLLLPFEGEWRTWVVLGLVFAFVARVIYHFGRLTATAVRFRREQGVSLLDTFAGDEVPPRTRKVTLS